MRCSLSILLLLTVVLLAPPKSFGQAFCSLRDPNAFVKDFFPESTSHRSFVRNISPEIARRIQERSGVPFDPREFGNHTLYAAFRGDQLIGLLQAHSEVVDWGVAEVVWATDAELKLAGFGFQRCRSPQRKKVLDAKVQEVFKGWSEADLRKRSADVDAILREAKLAPGSRKLVEGVVKGAMKMLAMVNTVWPEELAALRKRQPLIPAAVTKP